ncbi:MAG: hypothetical protein H0W66_05890 [Chthoniobacterales bacterium]|nr:hypothetical protein [Chthoniobacterales bacterium]
MPDIRDLLHAGLSRIRLFRTAGWQLIQNVEVDAARLGSIDGRKTAQVTLPARSMTAVGAASSFAKWKAVAGWSSIMAFDSVHVARTDIESASFCMDVAEIEVNQREALGVFLEASPCAGAAW